MPAIEANQGTPSRADTVLLEQLERKFSPGGIRRQRFRRFRSTLWLMWVNVLGGMKRFFDLALSTLLLVVLSPLLLCLYVFNRRGGGTVERTNSSTCLGPS